MLNKHGESTKNNSKFDVTENMQLTKKLQSSYIKRLVQNKDFNQEETINKNPKKKDKASKMMQKFVDLSKKPYIEDIYETEIYLSIEKLNQELQKDQNYWLKITGFDKPANAASVWVDNASHETMLIGFCIFDYEKFECYNHCNNFR